MIQRKTPEQVEQMAAAGAILTRCLQMLASKARAGVTTRELDEAAEKFIRSQDAEPAFKGYRGFPGSICASPNSMVVHGIPGPYECRRGDVLSIDVGVVKDGWVADAAMTVPIGAVTPQARKLLDVTRAALFAGAEQMRPGNHLGDVSAAIQQAVEIEGLSIIRTLVGHGIGREMHEDPQVPNFGEPGKGPVLEEGTVLAIEPMVNAGGLAWSAWATTAGPSTRRTARSRRTSSSRSRSPPRGRGSSPPGTRRALRPPSRRYPEGAEGAPQLTRRRAIASPPHFLSLCRSVLAVLIAAPATAGAAVQPYGTNDAGGFRNVLPPGENGLDTLEDVFTFKAPGYSASLRRPAAALRKPRLRGAGADRRRNRRLLQGRHLRRPGRAKSNRRSNRGRG